MFTIRKKWRFKFVICACLLVGIVLFSKSGEPIIPNNEDMSFNQTLPHVMKRLSFSTNLQTEEEDVPVQFRTMVILLTYMRSGSSLTGDLIQQSPDVFYIYEPLYTISKFSHNEKELKYYRKKDRISKPKSYDDIALGTLESMLTCNPFNIDVDTLRQYHYKSSLSTTDYMNCIKRSPGVMGTANCIPVLHKQCAKAKFTLVKTIRLHMMATKPLLVKYPNLKIIHLVRDPRGTLRSQRSVGEFKMNNAVNNTNRFCKRVLTDLKASETLNKSFPGRIKTLRYEDLAEQPIKVTEDLYRFLGLKMTSSLREYVWNITSAGNPDNCVICTTRNSSIATAYKWRNILNYNLVSLIDKTCSNVYKALGYVPLKTAKDQHNIQIAVKNPKKFIP